MAASDYVELRCRSAFSFLDGASLPEDLLAAAAHQGHHTLALGDVNGLYGAPRFFGAAQRAGVRARVGAEVTLTDSAAAPVLLLVESRAGYQNLCRLLTQVHAGRPKGTGSATHDLLAAHAEGLIARAGANARDDVPALLAAFGRDRLYLEAQRHFDAAEAHRVRAARAQAQAFGSGIVATNDVRYATPDRRRVHDVLTCARHKVTVDELGRRQSPRAEQSLTPPAEKAAQRREPLPRRLPAPGEGEATARTRAVPDRPPAPGRLLPAGVGHRPVRERAGHHGA